MTSNSASDAGTNAASVQETTTRAADEPAEQQQANVTINEQQTEGEQVVIESATLPEGGFIAIHDSSYQDAPLSSVLGNSVYLEAGTHENVTVTLARPISETQTLVAMPHLDTNNNQVYDFVLSTGEIDGPYTVDGQAVVDEANVSVAQETTTTTEEADGETTTTTEVEDEDEATTEVEDEDEATTEVEDEDQPAETERFVFQIERMHIDRWSFVIGDEETPDRTETVSNISITDRRVTINLSEILRQSAANQQEVGQMTTQSPEQVEQMIEENISKDIPTVRFVITDVTIENVTFVVTAPEDIELPQPPMMTTTTTEETTTTTEEETTTTTTTEEETTTTTTTETETPTEETTTTTTTETETPTEETTTTTTETETTTTTTEAQVDSFRVSGLDAPESVTAGETIDVTATISNPNDQQVTQSVAFRLEGTVVGRQTVTLDAGEQTTVTFEVSTEGIPPGQYVHGVYTQNFGELGIIVIEEAAAQTTTPAETETPAGNETTTTTTEA
ncbi:hypothetical protein [Halorussus sp. MSC15.2]|uniref:DUF7282 domain-containing protein n=1 Tax=Halorussus sp. MSC15.2 TaxID=2283638 RepID=UPI0013D7CC5B|nr:hypothetical protein [Halorussus sp. MSC15.2]NEU55446.1 hypothetical protein [Halorussus sp. MSC15.2]